MTDPTPLSPAQAVLNAYKEARDGQYINGEWIQNEAGQVAAALCAAALYCPRDRRILMTIAAELEGANG